MIKTKLAILAFLYCWEFVKNSTDGIIMYYDATKDFRHFCQKKRNIITINTCSKNVVKLLCCILKMCVCVSRWLQEKMASVILKLCTRYSKTEIQNILVIITHAENPCRSFGPPMIMSPVINCMVMVYAVLGENWMAPLWGLRHPSGKS